MSGFLHIAAFLVYFFFFCVQDNLNVFIDASRRHFGLKEAQLFAPADLQDFAERNKREM